MKVIVLSNTMSSIRVPFDQSFEKKFFLHFQGYYIYPVV